MAIVLLLDQNEKQELRTERQLNYWFQSFRLLSGVLEEWVNSIKPGRDVLGKLQ